MGNVDVESLQAHFCDDYGFLCGTQIWTRATSDRPLRWSETPRDAILGIEEGKHKIMTQEEWDSGMATRGPRDELSHDAQGRPVDLTIEISFGAAPATTAPTKACKTCGEPNEKGSDCNSCEWRLRPLRKNMDAAQRQAFDSSEAEVRLEAMHLMELLPTEKQEIKEAKKGLVMTVKKKCQAAALLRAQSWIAESHQTDVAAYSSDGTKIDLLGRASNGELKAVASIRSTIQVKRPRISGLRGRSVRARLADATSLVADQSFPDLVASEELQTVHDAMGFPVATPEGFPDLVASEELQKVHDEMARPDTAEEAQMGINVQVRSAEERVGRLHDMLLESRMRQCRAENRIHTHLRDAIERTQDYPAPMVESILRSILGVVTGR